MAGNDYYDEYIDRCKHKVFTLREAIEFMKELDRCATTHTVSWKSVNTGRPVAIGYTGS